MRSGFTLVGHRGARGLFPENTLEGFRAASALGLRAVELDVGVTRDGVVVVHHDPALNPDLARDASGAWIAHPPPLLKELTLAELGRFDVGRIRPGSRYAARYPAQRPIDGARVPTLEAVLRAEPGLHVTIEMKLLADRPEATVSPEAMAAAVAAVVEQAGAIGRVGVSCFDWRGVRAMRLRCPAIARGWLTERRTEAAPALWWDIASPPAAPEAIAAEGGGTWFAAHHSLSRDALARARRLGLRVVPWTVNEPDEMARLIARGVDGLITDRPDLAPPEAWAGAWAGATPAS
jgi:glycerophosphoryl diester phosphodiesterase